MLVYSGVQSTKYFILSKEYCENRLIQKDFSMLSDTTTDWLIEPLLCWLKSLPGFVSTSHCQSSQHNWGRYTFTVEGGIHKLSLYIWGGVSVVDDSIGHVEHKWDILKCNNQHNIEVVKKKFKLGICGCPLTAELPRENEFGLNWFPQNQICLLQN